MAIRWGSPGNEAPLLQPWWEKCSQCAASLISPLHLTSNKSVGESAICLSFCLLDTSHCLCMTLQSESSHCQWHPFIVTLRSITIQQHICASHVQVTFSDRNKSVFIMHDRLKIFLKLHLFVSDYFFCLKCQIISCISIVQAHNQRVAGSNPLILPQESGWQVPFLSSTTPMTIDISNYIWVGPFS